MKTTTSNKTERALASPDLSSLTAVYTNIGRVLVLAEYSRIVVLNSCNRVVKVIIVPDIIPGRINGRLTLRNV